ncbi:hypothetical protein SUGI_0702480 [Cryptomeria japonica]|nr:hypothetical protein SUGI_0702480 [Cryptomeria japonica]
MSKSHYTIFSNLFSNINGERADHILNLNKEVNMRDGTRSHNKAKTTLEKVKGERINEGMRQIDNKLQLPNLNRRNNRSRPRKEGPTRGKRMKGRGVT